MLDDKRPEVQAQLAGAPLVVDHLCAACKAYHEEVRALLTAAGVAFEDDPRLVRGLDYYTRTTFEFVHDGLGAQSAIGGGGRYDGLSEMLGGPAAARRRLGARRRPHVPGHGGRGADRRGRTRPRPGVRCRRWVTTPAAGCSCSCTELRRAGVAADMAFGGKGLKGAMKGADRSGARFA